MDGALLQQIQAEIIIEELTRCGVRRFCISPGSRNSPLVIAAAENPRARTQLFIDERAAAFHAVGAAKGNGDPAALICTSGTAVANYLPAAIEASHSAIPLIILSADRPQGLRDTGANQTIAQFELLGRHCRWSFDLPAPREVSDLDPVPGAVDQLVFRARRQPAGPVQLNCQFTEPLTVAPTATPPTLSGRLSAWRDSARPFTSYANSTTQPELAGMAEVVSLLEASRRGVIVAGRLDGAVNNDAILNLASRLGMPLLADIASGLRFTGRACEAIVTHYDLFLRNESLRRTVAPDLVLHLGGPVVSKVLRETIDASGAPHIVVDATPFRQDPGRSVTHRLEMAARDFAAGVAVSAAPAPSELLSPCLQADGICADLMREELAADEFASELTVAAQLLKALSADQGLFLGNSMPIRDADACGVTLDHRIRVGVNRGASGIDGCIASALGFAAGLERRSLAIIGDLAFLHDLNSLQLLRAALPPLTLVVINNDGGGIFSFLPVREATVHFEACFAAAHGLDLGAIVRSFGIEHQVAGTGADLTAALRHAASGQNSSVIEVPMDRQRNHAGHGDLWRRIDAALDAGLR